MPDIPLIDWQNLIPGPAGDGIRQADKASDAVNQNAQARINTVIAFCQAQIGKPYKWGATGPNAYDCSGLLYAAFKKIGVNLPRTTGLMINAGVEVKRDKLQRGDLVFPNPGHVGVYIGDNKLIIAPHTGAFVRVQTLNQFWRARRVVHMIPDVGDAVTGFVTKPLDYVKEIYNVFTEIAKIAAWLINPKNWLRIAAFLAGVALLFIALVRMTKIVPIGALAGGK